MQPVEIAALIENLCLRRVQVLRLSIPHHTASEADDTAVGIHDRVNDTVPELVLHAMHLVRQKKARLTQDFIVIPFFF